MTALYVILGIAVFLCLLAFSSIRIRIIFDGQIRLSLGYLFLNFKILPQKSSSKKEKKKQPTKAQTNKKKNGITEQLGDIIDIVKCVLENLSKVLKKVRIRPLVFDISIADEDAASTAIKTGAVNAIVWPFAGWLASTVRVRKQSINIAPDYNGKSRVYFDACIRIRLNHIIAAGFGVLAGVYKIKFIKDGAVK